MTTAKPPARYGAIEGARRERLALPSYTTTGDTTSSPTRPLRERGKRSYRPQLFELLEREIRSFAHRAI